MRHRHIVSGFEDSVEAVEDVLAAGTVDDWSELARRVAQDPDGSAARSLETVLSATSMYGTTRIWQHFLDECRRRGHRIGRV